MGSVQPQQPKNNDDDNDRTDDVQNGIHGLFPPQGLQVYMSVVSLRNALCRSVEAQKFEHYDDHHNRADDVEDRIHLHTSFLVPV